MKAIAIAVLIAAAVIISGCVSQSGVAPVVTTATGELVMQITDAPSMLNITSAFVTISNVQVHLANATESAETNDTETNSTDNSTIENETDTNDVVENTTEVPESSWITIVNESQTFDLIAIKDVEEVLGSAELATGRYTQIRLVISDATATINGTEYNLTIPSGTIKLVKSFSIVANETTTLTLDFDAQESIHKTGTRYAMKPTIKVIVE